MTKDDCAELFSRHGFEPLKFQKSLFGHKLRSWRVTTRKVADGKNYMVFGKTREAARDKLVAKVFHP